MRYAAGSLCSALLASVFTFWMTQPATNRLAAQDAGPFLPGSPAGPSQSQPPGLPPRKTFTPSSRPGDPLVAPTQSAPGTSSPATPVRPAAPLRPAPDPISLDRAAPPSTPEAAPASGEMFHENPKPLVAGLTNDGLTPDEAVSVAVYDKCNRGVVNITSKGLPGERFLFMEVPEEGSGSGSIIDRDGHVLTNYHVVENAQQIEVALFDGSTFPGKPVGADPVNDIAVLKIDAPPEKLFPIELGDSGRLKVGMRVFAIGNPFGLERTMTQGIVSSLNRSLQIRGNRSIKAIIQVDAAVNPGNSGGPLLDARGQLVGVTTAIATRVGQSAGVGLAIPATLVHRVVPQLIRHGRVIRPEIGIQQVLETENGLRIASLTPGGPAERAGLRGPQVARTRRGPFVWEQIDRSTADMIVAVDGEKVETADDFLNLVERKRPGDTVTVRVQRGNQTADVPVVLAGPPLTDQQPAAPAQLEPAR